MYPASMNPTMNFARGGYMNSCPQGVNKLMKKKIEIEKMRIAAVSFITHPFDSNHA